MEARIKKEHIIFVTLISIGIFLRFAVMTVGHNYDFESYCIVGEISGHFRNVYAETHRYNYGPIFLVIQGILYRIATLLSNWEPAYRVMMISTLTLADLWIACFVANRYDVKKALLFFLNPVSIIITGYHNQFDNIAILLALLSIPFYNEDERFGKRDWLFVGLLSLSLITKHILFILPLFLLLKKGLPLKKKLVYVAVPPLCFLISFVPFALQNSDAFHGILQNVFFYKSFNNSPLLLPLLRLIRFPMQYSILLFGLGMALLAFFIRRQPYEKQLLAYLIAMVALSSAIANQYLAIPLVALVVLDTGFWKYLYLAATTVYLALEYNGLGLLEKLVLKYFPTWMGRLCGTYVEHAYTILAWILFFALLYVLFLKKFVRDKLSRNSKGQPEGGAA